MGADHRAFLDATLPHLDVVYQVARHAAGEGQEPEDLVQETYLRAYAGFGSYRGGNARAWLAAICLNVARSEARRRRNRPWEVPGPALLDVLPRSRADGADGVADVADVVIACLDAQEVSRCLARLPEPQRVCIVLVDVAGYTAREAAETLGCPRGTVLLPGGHQTGGVPAAVAAVARYAQEIPPPVPDAQLAALAARLPLA